MSIVDDAAPGSSQGTVPVACRLFPLSGSALLRSCNHRDPRQRPVSGICFEDINAAVLGATTTWFEAVLTQLPQMSASQSVLDTRVLSHLADLCRI